MTRMQLPSQALTQFVSAATLVPSAIATPPKLNTDCIANTSTDFTVLAGAAWGTEKLIVSVNIALLDELFSRDIKDGQSMMDALTHPPAHNLYSEEMTKLEKTMQVFETKGDSVTVAQCMQRLGEILLALKQYPEVTTKLENAMRVFDTM